MSDDISLRSARKLALIDELVFIITLINYNSSIKAVYKLYSEAKCFRH